MNRVRTARHTRRRRPHRPPFRIGLTGSIGMGKSTVMRMFADCGVATFDADAAVHELTAPGGAALPAIDRAFPGVVYDDVLDRKALGARVFGNPADLARLEAILHPQVQALEHRFFRQCALRRIPCALCDIPLLFETGAAVRFDVVVTVSAPAFVQRQRVLRRPGMTVETLDRILARQWPDRDKRLASDFVISTGGSLRRTRRAVGAVMRRIKGEGNADA